MELGIEELENYFNKYSQIREKAEKDVKEAEENISDIDKKRKEITTKRNSAEDELEKSSLKGASRELKRKADITRAALLKPAQEKLAKASKSLTDMFNAIENAISADPELQAQVNEVLKTRYELKIEEKESEKEKIDTQIDDLDTLRQIVTESAKGEKGRKLSYNENAAKVVKNILDNKKEQTDLEKEIEKLDLEKDDDGNYINITDSDIQNKIDRLRELEKLYKTNKTELLSHLSTTNIKEESIDELINELAEDYKPSKDGKLNDTLSKASSRLQEKSNKLTTQIQYHKNSLDYLANNRNVQQQVHNNGDAVGVNPVIAGSGNNGHTAQHYRNYNQEITQIEDEINNLQGFHPIKKFNLNRKIKKLKKAQAKVPQPMLSSGNANTPTQQGGQATRTPAQEFRFKQKINLDDFKDLDFSDEALDYMEKKIEERANQPQQAPQQQQQSAQQSTQQLSNGRGR